MRFSPPAMRPDGQESLYNRHATLCNAQVMSCNRHAMRPDAHSKRFKRRAKPFKRQAQSPERQAQRFHRQAAPFNERAGPFKRRPLSPRRDASLCRRGSREPVPARKPANCPIASSAMSLERKRGCRSLRGGPRRSVVSRSSGPRELSREISGGFKFNVAASTMARSIGRTTAATIFLAPGSVPNQLTVAGRRPAAVCRGGAGSPEIPSSPCSPRARRRDSGGFPVVPTQQDC